MNDPLTAAPGLDEAQAVQRLVARVRAWQHRQPLAARIEPAQVGGWGVVALPFAPAGMAEGTAAAGPASARPTPLFHQPALLPGLSHRALVEFALAHGVAERPGPAAWPQRDVERADATPEPAPLTLHLLTAAIQDLPDRPGAPPRVPRRLLLAPAHAAVWGPRPVSRRRAAAAAGAVVLLVAASVGTGWRAGDGALPAVPAAGLPAPAASAASAVSAERASAFSVSASGPASAPAPAAAAAVASAVPPSVASAASPGPAAAVGVAPAPASAPVAAPGPSAPASLPQPAPASATTPPPPAVSAPMPPARRVLPPGPHFALVSVPVKQKAAAEFTLQRVQQVLGPAQGDMQVQIMPTPQGYVVTLWPLPSQADAERVAEVLARRGVPMKWMEF